MSNDVKMDVSQGSVSDPILPHLHINELDTLTSNMFITMYVDDQSFIISETTDETIKVKCNNVLDILDNWYAFCSQHCNAEKPITICKYAIP